MSSSTTATMNGPAWAAVLAAGIGCATFGVIVDLAEAFPRVSKGLTISDAVGDLSGKSTLAVVLWIAVWVVLHLRWKQRNIACTGRITLLSSLFVLVGLLAVLPPIMELMAGK